LNIPAICYYTKIGFLTIHPSKKILLNRPICFREELQTLYMISVGQRPVGLEHCMLGDLRKTCNAVMKENGVSIEAAMQVLGHSTAQVNLKYYTGILTKRQKAAVNSLPSIG